MAAEKRGWIKLDHKPEGVSTEAVQAACAEEKPRELASARSSIPKVTKTKKN